MPDFVPLTKALEGWFDKPLAKLPKARQKRVREDLRSVIWDELSAEERRRAAKEWDDRHSPASGAGKDRYIDYLRALRILEDRFDATPEELAAWIFLGPSYGGIAAYLNANELDPPPEFCFQNYYDRSYDSMAGYLKLIMNCWFLEKDVEDFNPDQRFISGKALIKRWREELGSSAVDYIETVIRQSRLLDMHPTCGQTQGSNPGNDMYPPLEAGLFFLSEVEEIEQKKFGWPVRKSRQKPALNIKEWHARNAAKAAHARHNQPGGSRDKRQQIREIWATGKYSSRDRCAEEECAALGMSYSTARKALRNTPEPGAA